MVATLGNGQPGTLLQYLPVSKENIVLSVQYERFPCLVLCSMFRHDSTYKVSADEQLMPSMEHLITVF